MHPALKPPELPEKPSAASRYLYANATRTNDIKHWLSTDGPTNESELDDLLQAVASCTKIGSYQAGKMTQEWDGRSKPRILIKGPRRGLIISPKAVRYLRHWLSLVRELGAYRIVKRPATLRGIIFPK